MSIDGRDIEFNKVTGQNSTSLIATVVNSQRVGVGGREGPKSKITIATKREVENPRTANFFTKETDYTEEQMEEMMRSYNFLRENGFPVPNTVRYFEENGKMHILMTDIAPEGTLVWGLSENMTSKQREDLIKMDINQADIEALKAQIVESLKKASELNVALKLNYYHLTKNMETGKVELVFLDLSPDVINHIDYGSIKEFAQFDSRSLWEANLSHARSFVASVIGDSKS